MEENNLFLFFLHHIESDFSAVAVLKESEGTRITHLRHKTSKMHFVLRECSGHPEVYQKLLTVSCPNLPQIYEIAEADGRLLVLEEYIQGDSLHSILECGTLSTKQTRKIALQVCEALWTLHSLGAVHRDVKPDNIILRGDEAVLIDFDASRLKKPEKHADTLILGTTGYAAPEQYGLSQTDGRADIYALGIVMNVMLTGQHPSTLLAGGHMGRVIRRCTMMNPDQRFRDVRHLMESI